MSRHGNRDNFRDYEEGDHLEWNISRWWAQNLGQLLEYSRLESTFTTSALSVLLSPQPVWLFIASHLLHQLTLFHTRHLVPLILIAWCSWEIKDLYFIWPFCLLTESKPVTNAAILRFELFTGLSLWGPLGPGRVTNILKHWCLNKMADILHRWYTYRSDSEFTREGELWVSLVGIFVKKTGHVYLGSQCNVTYPAPCTTIHFNPSSVRGLFDAPSRSRSNFLFRPPSWMTSLPFPEA